MPKVMQAAQEETPTEQVTRESLLDWQTYVDKRLKIREAVLATKASRRIHVGEYFTFLFENAETVRYQVQEMMRVERIVREKDIAHELNTYNALLGKVGELGCTLLIEIDNQEQRETLLRQWHALPKHLYCLLEDGNKVYASYDKAQMNEEKLSAVQFLKFDVGGHVPVAIGSDLTAIQVESVLSAVQREALASDLNATH